MSDTNNTIPVSVIVLAHKPNQLLESCLASIQWSTERLLVATQESPEWTKLAKKCQAVLVQYPGEVTDFSKVRNWALTIASEEWVMFVDSDEQVTPNSVPEIEKAIHSYVDGVIVTRRDVFNGKTLIWGEAGNTKLLRLARNKHFKFVRPVHEVAEVPGVVVEADIVINHYAHSSVTEFLKSVTKYAEMEAEYRLKEGAQFSVSRMLLFPPGKGVFNLLFKLGILDGYNGFMYAVLMSLHSLMVSVYMYEKQKSK